MHDSDGFGLVPGVRILQTDCYLHRAIEMRRAQSSPQNGDNCTATNPLSLVSSIKIPPLLSRAPAP